MCKRGWKYAIHWNIPTFKCCTVHFDILHLVSWILFHWVLFVSFVSGMKEERDYGYSLKFFRTCISVEYSMCIKCCHVCNPLKVKTTKKHWQNRLEWQAKGERVNWSKNNHLCMKTCICRIVIQQKTFYPNISPEACVHVYFCRGRIFAKRINVRLEHVRHSKCRDDFLR